MKKTDENSQFQFGNCENPGGGSRFFKNVWIRIRLKYNPRNKTKFGLFQCKYTLLKKNMTFYIIKRGRISLCFALSIQIWLFRWISEGVGRHQYVLNFKHVWICSERGGWYFSKMSEIQKCLNYPRGGGSSLIGNLSQIFPFFLVTPPLIQLGTGDC